MHSLQEKIKHVPTSPGVYWFKNKAGIVIYIGKAINLKKRIQSYFRAQSHPTQKIYYLQQQTHTLEYLVVNNEVEALLLEQNLIKQHKPKFNIDLKDDKKYIYLRLTEEEPFPRIFTTRNLQTKKTTYLGPYTSVKNLQTSLQLARKIFKFRTCNPTLFSIASKRQRPCLDYHLHLCWAPCVGKISLHQYQESIAQSKRFLMGSQNNVLRSLQKNMYLLSKEQQFEQAAALRDMIQALKTLVEKQPVILKNKQNCDVFGLAIGKEISLGNIYIVREGKLIDRKSVQLLNTSNELPETILKNLLIQYYSKAFELPSTILIPFTLTQHHVLETWLEKKKSAKKNTIHLHTPQRGPYKKLLCLAEKDSQEQLALAEREWQRQAIQNEKTLIQLQKVLYLPTKPERIEAYDISHFGGTHTVGSMVVFEHGKPHKNLYRKFAIKQDTAADDYAALREMLSRRLAHLRKKEQDPAFARKPDLILIDGGKGQLNAVKELIQTTSTATAPIGLASLAKREEEIFLTGKPSPIRLPKNSPVLFLLQHIRDEAHRFALSFQRRKRSIKN